MSKKHSHTQDTSALEEDRSTAESDEMSKDTLFELLKNRRRRDTLQFLDEEDGESTLSDLAEKIAAKENETDIRSLSSDERKRVYIGLYQCHLPKLDDADVIDFDKHRGDVELHDIATELAPYLDGVDTEEATAPEQETRQTEADDPTGTETERLPAARQHRDHGHGTLTVAGVVGSISLAGLVGVPGFRRVPNVMWLLVSAAVALVSLQRQTSDQH